MTRSVAPPAPAPRAAVAATPRSIRIGTRTHAPFGDSGAVLHLAGELAAGGVDVVAAGLAHGGDDARLLQDCGEGAHALARRARAARTRETD